jgi:hypothetical protein
MAQIHAQGYRWEFGEEQGILSLKVTYLVGFPESQASTFPDARRRRLLDSAAD